MSRDSFDWDEMLIPYRQAVKELCVKFDAYALEYHGREKHSPIELVTGRVKRVASILDKANRKALSVTDFSQISEGVEDIAGIRIICRFVEDIERAAALIRQRTDLRIVRERDYVTHTKPSGYRSYHMHIRYPVTLASGNREVLAEIQIRTMAMDFWATIEHSLKYKYNGNMPEPLRERLIKSAEAAFQLDQEISTIRDEIMEAQRMQERRNDLTDKILKNIKNLYSMARFDKVDELNQEFLALNEEGSIEKLQAFNQQLQVMAQLYQVEYY